MVIDASIVRDEGEVFDASFEQARDQRLGNAAKAKATRSDDHTVKQQAG